MLPGFKNLEYLGLSYNGLTGHLDFPRLPNLFSLLLDHNLINALPADTFIKLPKIKILDLVKNEFTCDCRFEVILNVSSIVLFCCKLWPYGFL